MNRPIALLWLAATYAPIACLIFFFSLEANSSTLTYSEATAQFDFLIWLNFYVILAFWFFVATYIVYLFKTVHVPVGKRALWVAVLIFGNLLAVPVFWYLYVWRPTRPAP